MHPLLFTISLFGKDFTIASYGVLLAIAIISSVLLTLYLSKKSPFSLDDTFTLSLIILSCGLAGAYIVGFLFSIPDIMSHGFDHYQPILISWGGILGGIIAALICIKHFKMNLSSFADLCSPGYLLGIGIGRIGCFFGGCCYGVHTDSWCGVTFTDPIALASHALQPLVPTQIISAVVLISLGILFSILYSVRKWTPGFLFGLSAVCYSLFRFTIEFWRDDPRMFFFSLSDGQLFSLVFGITGLFIIIKTQGFSFLGRGMKR